MLTTRSILNRWKKAAIKYTEARLAKQDVSDILSEASELYKTGRVKLNSAELSTLTRELVLRLEKSAEFNMVVMAGGALGLAVDSAKPRSRGNIAPVLQLAKFASPGPVEGEIVTVHARTVRPVLQGKFWLAKIERISRTSKSRRQVPDTIKEVLRTAEIEGVLYSDSKTMEALRVCKILKAKPPSADVINDINETPTEAAFSLDVALLKADGEKQIAYGVVYEPDRVDTDGDSAGADAIEEAAHNYLADFSDINLMHERPLGDKVKVVESYIAPCDFAIGSQMVRKGSWVMAVYIDDQDLWQAVKEKKLNAFSIEGTGIPA